MEETRQRITATVSPAGEMTASKWEAFFSNLLRFTAPGLAVFFGQLALGVEPRAAALVALVTLYGVLADFFKKIRSEDIQR